MRGKRTVTGMRVNMTLMKNNHLGPGVIFANLNQVSCALISLLTNW